MIILQHEIFKSKPIQANVFALLITTLFDIYQAYPIASNTTTDASVGVWNWIVARARDIVKSNQNQYILAKTLGAIVNGANQIADDALNSVDELFGHAFRVCVIVSIIFMNNFD